MKGNYTHHFIALFTSFVTLCVILHKILTGSSSFNLGEPPVLYRIIFIHHMVSNNSSSPHSLPELLPTCVFSCIEATRGLIGRGAGVTAVYCSLFVP